LPGVDRSALYPSTVAYIAALLLHRYKVLGILDDDGRAIRSVGILAMPQTRKTVELGNGGHQGESVPKLRRGGP